MNFEKTDTHSDVTLFKMFVCLSISVLMVLLSFFWSLDKVGKELEFLASKKKFILGLVTIYLFSSMSLLE